MNGHYCLRADAALAVTSVSVYKLAVRYMSVVHAVNPPAPVSCPIGGRYSFIQEGAPEELFTTRIRGITERPRHLIDCMEYVSEFKSCDDNPKKIYVDHEYCATLDHTAKPIGEYGEQLL